LFDRELLGDYNRAGSTQRRLTVADIINDALKNIKLRKRKLEAELKLLVKAEESLRQIVNAGGDSGQKGRVFDVPPLNRAVPTSGVSGAVWSALRDLGEAESSSIIAQIRKNYLPEANENTIRSLLSVWAVKGRVVRNGKKYSLPKETQNEAAPA
jgi:hypothetical protein